MVRDTDGLDCIEFRILLQCQFIQHWFYSAVLRDENEREEEKGTIWISCLSTACYICLLYLYSLIILASYLCCSLVHPLCLMGFLVLVYLVFLAILAFQMHSNLTPLATYALPLANHSLFLAGRAYESFEVILSHHCLNIFLSGLIFDISDGLVWPP